MGLVGGFEGVREKRTMTYIWALGVALKEGFYGFILFVELSEIGHEIFDDVSVG